MGDFMGKVAVITASILFYRHTDTHSRVLINHHLSNLYYLTRMSIFDKLASKNLFWSVKASSLPANIREYMCEFVIDQLQSDAPQPTERIYLRFTHPQTGSYSFHPPASSIYEAEINIEDLEEPKTALSEQFDAICFTTIRDYQPPLPQIKEIEYNENSPYHSEEEICTYLDIDSGRSYSEGEDDVSLIDYAPQNEKEVRHKVLLFLKNPANRFKKMKEIKAHLKRQKFNVPDNHIKAILTTYCGSHIMDKKKGFLVHEDYLSLEEKNQRRRQFEELERKQRQKEVKKSEKKKATKKETKAQKSGKKVVSIAQEEIQEYAKASSSMAKEKELLAKQSKQPRKR